MQQMGSIPRTGGTQRGAELAGHMQPRSRYRGALQRSRRLSHSPAVRVRDTCSRAIRRGSSAISAGPCRRSLTAQLEEHRALRLACERASWQASAIPQPVKAGERSLLSRGLENRQTAREVLLTGKRKDSDGAAG